MNLCGDALEVLKATSRTFYVPISRLPSGLQEAVSSAYLCMRAIDEIEDHPNLHRADKARMGFTGASLYCTANLGSNSYNGRPHGLLGRQ
jgi:hypothetical protein